MLPVVIIQILVDETLTAWQKWLTQKVQQKQEPTLGSKLTSPAFLQVWTNIRSTFGPWLTNKTIKQISTMENCGANVILQASEHSVTHM